MTDSTHKTITFDGTPLQTRIAGRYELLGRIGKGGMAEVFKGRDMVLQRDVAVKIMLPKFANDPTFAKRFLAEAQAAAQLRSPHTVAVYDAGENQGRRFIVMELVHGKNLKSILKATDKLPPRNVARLALQACLALREAHDVGIVHRDVKPANIMITHGARKGEVNVQITDFGIAKIEHLLNVTDDKGLIMGTPRYMSPEQFRGNTGTALSDQYSLGLVMYEAVTGCMPYIGTDTSNLAEWHEHETPIHPQLLRQEVDDALNGIIMRTLAKDPIDRFADCGELADALEAYLADDEHRHITVPYPKSWVVDFMKGPESIQGSMRHITGRSIIGRGTTADIIVPDGTVSREHLQLTPRGMYLELKNLSKSNGTIIDDTFTLHGRMLCEAGTICDLGKVRIRIGRIS